MADDSPIDKILSQAALSVLTNLSKMYLLPAESSHITYNDMVKIIMQFGVNVKSNIRITYKCF